MANFVSGYMTEDGKFFEDSREADRYEMGQEFCRLYKQLSSKSLRNDGGGEVQPEDIHDWLTSMSAIQLTQFKAMVRDLRIPKDDMEDDD